MKPNHLFTLPNFGSYITLIALIVYSSSLVAQTKTITGQVTAAEDGTPLTGVTVLGKGTSKGTFTDIDGNYSIDLPNSTTALTFSYVGYQNREVEIENQSVIDVTLMQGSLSLDEVVVTGYGEQSRQTLTSAVSKVDSRTLENTVFSNAAAALQGTVSGVRVQTTSGQPGATPRVIVRGGASINNPDGATPLYIVDGVIREDIEGINSQDIESMQVLKDASATAIYGARASNGVVIVTLKKGVAGKTRINYNFNMGFSDLREKYDVLNARDYIYFARLGVQATGIRHPERTARLDLAFGEGTGNDLTNNTPFTTQYLSSENEHKLNEGWESMPDPLDPSKTIIFQGTDWQDVLFRTGITQDHYLSFSGGSEKSTFNVGVGYTDIEGMAIETFFQRFSTNLSGRLEVKPNLFVFGNLNFSRESDNRVFSENQLFERAIAMPPTTKFQFEDGTLAPGIRRNLGNPAYHLSRIDNRNEENFFTISGGFNWEVLPDLVFEPVASLFYTVNDFNSFEKSYLDSPTNFIDSRNTRGTFDNLEQRQVDGTLTYTKSFANVHNFQGKLGFSYFHRFNNSLFAQGQGAATDLVSTLNSAAVPIAVNGFASQLKIFGYFGRITYDYDRKYLFTLNARYDGASNLGDENKWGFFPGISAGWNIHNENFWNDPLSISTLKLRASYGINGNLGNLGDFQAQGQYSVGNTYQNSAAVENTILANQALQWEESKTVDVGFDMGLFNNRVTVLFDYYRRVTENLITTLELPQSTGFTNILTNLGSLENNGVELEVGANILNRGGFSWDLSFNASYNKNKILKLPENDNENNRIGGYQVYDPAQGKNVWVAGLQEGSEIGDLYGYQFQFVYPTDEAAADGPKDEILLLNDVTLGGDAAWLDVNQDGIINTFDRVKMGNIYPDWTGGFSSNVSYKGLNLYARLDFITGHTIYNYVRANMNGNFVGQINYTSDVLNAWQEQGDQTNVPRVYWADQINGGNYWRGDPRNINNGNGSSQNYEKGDFLALREITLSYDLPKSLYESIGISNLRLNATANNLRYFTQFSGYTPEIGGSNRGRYPVPRIIQFGLKATL